MLDDFILRALFAGIGIAIVCAPLGCFVVWRRMSYFGDSLAHSSLLGIALGLLLGMNINLGILLVSSGFAMLLLWLQQHKVLATDTLLGILAHAALSIGLVTISLMKNQNIDVYSYLFGDILSVAASDIGLIYAGGSLVLMLVAACWSRFTLMALNHDLAQAEGVSTFWMNLLFMILMSVVVAISIRIVGIILITSMLIIPAATARQIATNPKQMAWLAMLMGCVSVVIGMLASFQWDTPSGPTIVTAATGLFASVLAGKLIVKQVLLKKSLR